MKDSEIGLSGWESVDNTEKERGSDLHRAKSSKSDPPAAAPGRQWLVVELPSPLFLDSGQDNWSDQSATAKDSFCFVNMEKLKMDSSSIGCSGGSSRPRVDRRSTDSTAASTAEGSILSSCQEFSLRNQPDDTVCGQGNPSYPGKLGLEAPESEERKRTHQQPGLDRSQAPGLKKRRFQQQQTLDRNEEEPSLNSEHAGVQNETAFPCNTQGKMSGSDGNWRNDRDTPHRREMIQHIMELLKKDGKCSPEIDRAKLLEVCLYRRARSFRAYMDMSTLEKRLQQAAVEAPPSSSSAADQNHQWKLRMRNKQQRLLLLHHSAMCTQKHCQVTSRCAAMKRTLRHMKGCTDKKCIVAHCASSKAILTHYHQCKDKNCLACGPVREVERRSQVQPGRSGNGLDQRYSSSNRNGFGSSVARVERPSQPEKYRSEQPETNRTPLLSLPSTFQTSKAVMSSTSSLQSAKRLAGSSDAQRIRQKQQRLLLLRHASQCQHKVGTCPVSIHCASSKKLWEHLAYCKNDQCKVQHCLSSREVLNHFRQCSDPHCRSCGPVRAFIRRSSEREKSRG